MVVKIMKSYLLNPIISCVPSEATRHLDRPSARVQVVGKRLAVSSWNPTPRTHPT